MKGTYVLVIGLADAETIRVGSLGEQRFPAGFYAYVGSAQGGIEQRVGRHRAMEKRLRWHVDYLLEKGTVLYTLCIPFGDRTVECTVAGILMRLEDAGFRVRGFGCSDCGCRTHLTYLGSAEEARAALEIFERRLSVLGSVHKACAGSNGSPQGRD